MAWIQMNLLSQKLMRTVPVNVIMPADKMIFPGMKQREEKPYKTLYLLHGVFGNYTDWVNGSRIQRFAEENDLVVIMPSGDNAFWIDHPKSVNYYGEFVGQELVELTRKIFPLSKKREDTFIGGLSMGGYGAIRNGLKYYENFSAIIALSSALIIEDVQTRTNDAPFFLETRDYAEALFGDLSKVLESDINPKFLVKMMKQKGIDIPTFYMACGEQDSLLGVNQQFADFLKEKDVPVTLEIGPGNHEWDFWDTYIQRALKWLPLEENICGINSGNIRI